MPRRTARDSNLRTIDPQFRVTLPSEVRRVLKADVGDLVSIQVEDGRVVIRKARVSLD